MLIFDMDGTMIDSNGIWRDVDIAFLEKRSLPYTKEYYEGVAHTIFPLAAVFTKEYCKLEESTDEIMAECENMNYGDFKLYVADIIIDSLKPIQDEYKRIESDKAYLNEVMKDGAERAAKRAYRMLSKVQKKIGFLPLPR